jgi:hypothetical protein
VQVQRKGRYNEFSKTYPFSNPAPGIVSRANPGPEFSKMVSTLTAFSNLFSSDTTTLLWTLKHVLNDRTRENQGS